MYECTDKPANLEYLASDESQILQQHKKMFLTISKFSGTAVAGYT